MGGNGTTFCNSTSFNSSGFFSLASGLYYLAFGGQIQTVSVTNGSVTATVTGGGCTTCLTPTATPTLTATPTQTPTPTPTPGPLYYLVDRRATCNTGTENIVAEYIQLPYAFTPVYQGWYRDSSGTCTYSYRLSNITPQNPGIFTPIPVDAVTYANSTLACGAGCIPTPTPTPTTSVTATPTPTPTKVYFYYNATYCTSGGPLVVRSDVDQFAGAVLLVDAINYVCITIGSASSPTAYAYDISSAISVGSCANASCSPPPPPPPPPPPVTYYVDYVRCTGVNAYISPIYTVATSTAITSITISGNCFSPVDGTVYTGTANYPIRTYTSTGCACS